MSDRTIYISNFGPIDNVFVDLDKSFQIYIGAQATGKSTICKAVYFCEELRDFTLGFLLEEIQKLSHDACWGDYMNYLKRRFMGCFGKTTHMKPFVIRYAFGGHEIEISLKDGYVVFHYSEKLHRAVRSLIKDAGSLHQMIDDAAQKESFFEQLDKHQMIRQQLRKRLDELFVSNQEVIYIPAGRSLLATLSEQLQDYSLTEMDLTMQNFITLIRRMKGRFGNKIPEMVEEYKRTVDSKINKTTLETAYAIIKKILKADYTSDSEGEKMYFDEYHWVKLMYSSSGQQEVLWILMLLFVLILQKKKAFVVIEEPEAHLFPIAQRDIVQFIALMVNATGSSVLITTHSPYILTSANVLLYSSHVEKENGAAVVPVGIRISDDIFEAYKVVSGGGEGSVTESIFDPEIALISTDYIDEVSGITNEEFNRLIEVSVANDM